jgi:hypothetical protein
MHRFEHAIAILDQSNHDDPSLRRELAEAKRCLEMCARLGLDGRERVCVLPVPKTVSPTSEYRLIEDHETEDRHWWTEVTIEGARVRPRAHWLLVVPRGR